MPLQKSRTGLVKAALAPWRQVDYTEPRRAKSAKFPFRQETTLLVRKLEKAVAVSGVCATNSRISGTGKGKPAGNLGSTLPRPCPHLPCGVFLKSTVPAFSSFSELGKI